MPDTQTSWNSTARNTKSYGYAINTTSGLYTGQANSTGRTRIANTLAIVDAANASAATWDITVHDSGLIEFTDVDGNTITTRQKTVRLLVEKLIALGIVS